MFHCFCTHNSFAHIQFILYPFPIITVKPNIMCAQLLSVFSEKQVERNAEYINSNGSESSDD